MKKFTSVGLEKALPRRWLEPSLTEKKEPTLKNSGDSKFSVVGMAGAKALRQDSEKARWGNLGGSAG